MDAELVKQMVTNFLNTPKVKKDLEDWGASLKTELDELKAKETPKKIESKEMPKKDSTTATMESKLATLSNELEVYLALFAKHPSLMEDKTCILIEESDWGRSAKTQKELGEFLCTHNKVDGRQWSVGEFGSRWARPVINGRKCQIAFYSKKSNLAEFKDVPGGKIYRIVVDLLESKCVPVSTHKEAKRRRNAEEYSDIYPNAIHTSELGTTTWHTDEMRKLLRVIVKGRRKSAGETVFCWNRQHKMSSWLTNEDMQEQARDWRRMMKGGEELQFLEENCETKLINGEEWHILVCGHKTEDYGIDPLGSGIDDGVYFVSGLIYWFKHKASRDAIFAYLTK